jgi:predicted lipoprotein with Yx(FWY)xxD motif
MINLRTARLYAGGIVGVASIAVLLAACGSSSNTSTTSAAAATAPASSAASTSTTSTTASAAGGTMIGTATAHGQTYLTGTSGRAIYLWVADTGGKSSCSGACAQAWPPVLTKGKPVAGSGVNAADLGTTTRSDGTEEVTYHGHPLYYFIADKSAGQTTGQGSDSFGAKWWLLTPAGTAITSSGSSSGGASSSSGASSTSSSSGGWG